MTHMTAEDWWKYYLDLYTHYALPENTVARGYEDPKTGKVGIDHTWFEFAAEAHMIKVPKITGLYNHSNMSPAVDYPILRRMYDLEE